VWSLGWIPHRDSTRVATISVAFYTSKMTAEDIFDPFHANMDAFTVIVVPAAQHSGTAIVRPAMTLQARGEQIMKWVELA
jgi:hypothetical protein